MHRIEFFKSILHHHVTVSNNICLYTILPSQLWSSSFSGTFLFLCLSFFRNLSSFIRTICPAHFILSAHCCLQFIFELKKKWPTPSAIGCSNKLVNKYLKIHCCVCFRCRSDLTNLKELWETVRSVSTLLSLLSSFTLVKLYRSLGSINCLLLEDDRY